MRYVRSPPSGLKDSTAWPAFFIAPAMNPRTVCLFQPILSMISVSVAPFLRWSIATTCAVLLPSRGPVASCAFAAFLPLGAAFAGVAFFPGFPFVGAALADCAPPLAFLAAFGSAGAVSGLGCAASPRPWMRCQIRAPAVLGSFSFFAGFSPGRLFRIANRRSAGQPAANSASSCSLVKLSNGVCAAAEASSGVANATISFVSLIVKVVIIVLLYVCRALRGHHIHLSEVLERQGFSEINLRWRRNGDGRRRSPQISPDEPLIHVNYVEVKPKA